MTISDEMIMMMMMMMMTTTCEAAVHPEMLHVVWLEGLTEIL
jgi:hypothetical protein